MKYSVKMIIKHTVETGEVFLEESVVLFDAASFDAAYRKAEQYVKEYEICRPYENRNGQRVQPELLSYADCFSVYEEADGTEVYSSFIRCRRDLPEETVAAVLEEVCSPEEMLPLRRR